MTEQLNISICIFFQLHVRIHLQLNRPSPERVVWMSKLRFRHQNLLQTSLRARLSEEGQFFSLIGRNERTVIFFDSRYAANYKQK